MKKQFLISIFSLFLLSATNSVAQDDVVITINEREISIAEFENRLNNIPQTVQIPVDELKENMVSTLIAETVLSYEALIERLDTLERVELLREQFKNESLYEEWMNLEIKNKVTVTEQELEDAYPRIKENRYVEFWTAGNEREADTLKRTIAHGITPQNKSELKKIEFSEALPNVENIVYNLRENEYSEPVRVDSIFYIFKLIKKEAAPEFLKYNYIDLKPEIEKRIRTRKENNLADLRLGQLMADKALSINKDAYKFLLQQLYAAIYNKDRLKYESPELLQQEIFLKEVSPDNSFNQTLISFNDGTQMTVLDWWKALSVSPYPLNFKNPFDLQYGLFEIIKRIVLFRSIVVSSKNKMYDNSDYVIEQSNMWGNNLLAQALLNRFRSNLSINENDLINLYDSAKQNFIKPEMRKIIPVVVNDKELAEQLYVKAVNGEDIIKIATGYSINKLTLKSESPGVFITENMWGEIGKSTFELGIGEICEPVANSDSTFAFVKLIEIRNPAPYPYDEIKSKLRTVLEDSRLQKVVDGFLTEHIKNYDIKINREALGKAKYYGGNMGVKKTHFPLRSASPAFPLLDANAIWYKEIIAKN